MTRIGSKLLTVAAAWVALCSAAFAADTPSAGAQPQLLSASAGEPLPAAAPAGAVATSNDDQTAHQIDAWLAGDGAPGAPQGGPQDQGAPPPRAIHGEAGVAFGSGGYRDAYVAADIPVGQRSDVGVAVSDTQLPSRHGFGGGDYKSLALSVNINTGKGGGPCGAPHWGEVLPTDRPGCVAPAGEGAGLAPGLAAMEAQAQR